ncbi:uncharacterized protein LOC108680942 [Hyalella azteca]|uniref:Uncharacterized protein LOC108680942 n=1 Tax=Hyalella azteca TaxID=294128 RepID=A0A979FJP1_HYAAZ|nr:uncharacterized protein LOC108680942 [Hyalella azteca]
MASNGNRQLEWVEIIEPSSRNIMYANLTTGQCVWELPDSVPYKKFDANQWWELFDSKTARFYYYNATSSKTVWKRPQNCDIIPLAKLQQLKQNTEVGCGPEVGLFGEPRRTGSGRGSSPSTRSPAPHAPDGFDGTNLAHMAKQQSLDGVAGRVGAGGSSLRGLPPSEGSLERPRQLGLSRSHSFMSGPVGSGSGKVLGDLGGMGRLHTEGASDSLEGLATPMLHRRHRYDAQLLDRRPDSADRYRYDGAESRPLRASASAHTALHHTPPYRPHSDSESSPSPPTQRHRFSPLEPSHRFSPLNSPHRFSPLESPHRLPDSGTSTLTTEHNSCCSPHASQHSLFDSGHMSMGTTGSRGSENHARSGSRASETHSHGSEQHRHRKSIPDVVSSRKSDRGSDATTSPPSSSSTAAPGAGSRSKCSHHRSSGSHHHHHSRHQCAKHRGVDKPTSSSSSSPKQLVVGSGSTASTITNSSTKTATDSDTIQTNSSSHHTNSNNASLKGSPCNTANKAHQNMAKAPAPSEETCGGVEGGGGGDWHQDLTHLYSNLDYVYNQPVYQYILEQAQLSGYRLGDRVLGGDGDSLHSDSDAEHRMDDSDHFADDEAVSNADSSSQENLDEINYLADDETYTQFFTPPLQTSQGLQSSSSHHGKPSSVHTSLQPFALKTSTTAMFPGKSGSCLPFTSNVPPSVDSKTNINSKISGVKSYVGGSVASSSAKNASVSPSNAGVNISGVISIESGGGGVMGFGASSQSIADSLSKLSVANASADAGVSLPVRQGASVVDGVGASGDSIRKPLLATVDKNLKTAACDMFRLVQVYMVDRKPKPDMTLSSVALDIIGMAHASPCLRDELFVQLCKQTTDNHRKYCPHNPTYHTLFPEVNKWPIHIQVAHYAGVCQKRLARSTTRPPTRKPCAIELDLAKLHIFRVSMFNSMLEEVMQLQRDKYPYRRLPWVQTALSEEVLRLQGTNTEGIFRVPADSDEVQEVKQQVEQWEVGECRDAHVAAAVLKLWYRELHEPLIPSALYDAAVEAHDNPTAALEVLQRLPPTHHLVLAYLIRFLQYFAQPEIVAATKMNADNLAMVMAPNCLRCTSSDPVVIYNNTRKEMAFLRLLIQNLDTTFMEGVV